MSGGGAGGLERLPTSWRAVVLADCCLLRDLPDWCYSYWWSVWVTVTEALVGTKATRLIIRLAVVGFSFAGSAAAARPGLVTAELTAMQPGPARLQSGAQATNSTSSSVSCFCGDKMQRSEAKVDRTPSIFSMCII